SERRKSPNTAGRTGDVEASRSPSLIESSKRHSRTVEARRGLSGTTPGSSEAKKKSRRENTSPHTAAATATLTPTTAATCARLIKTSSHQKPHPPQLVAASTHLTTRFNHVLTFTQRLTLIVRLLTPPQSDLNLRSAIHKIQLQRHHCITLIVHARIQPVDLFTMQKKLALPSRSMVRPRALGVLRNMDVFQPRFPSRDRNKTIHEGRAPHPKRLHFRAVKHQARLEDVLNRIIMTSLTITRHNIAVFLGHDPSLLQGDSRSEHGHRINERAINVHLQMQVARS